MLRGPLVVALVTIVGLVPMAGCSNQASLTIDLKSDFVPLAEIASVRTTLTAGTRVVSTTPLTLGSENLVDGLRVAELQGLAPGDYVVRVDVLGPMGTLVGSRNVSISLAGTYALTVVLSRDCAGLSCPGAMDDAGSTECYHGRCVPPTCAEGGTSCGAEACTIAAHCAPPAAECAHAECLDGECFQVADDGACGSDEVCVPSTGCVRLEPRPDAGGVDAGGVDAGDMPVDSGGGGCGSCDDGNGCTDDSCVSGSCVHSNNGAGCNDGNDCTHSDHCEGGGCTGSGYSCSPPPCMTSSCDGSGGCSVGGGCGPGSTCDGSGCVACGGADQICCGGSGCNSGLWCYSGVCTCAQPGGPCCPWDGSCAGGSTCEGGTCCFVGGGDCSHCCSGSRCASGMCFPF